MKTIFAFCLAAGFLAVPIAAIAEPGSVGNVTISLTLSFSAPGTVIKDGNGKVAGGATYGNQWTIVTAAKEENYVEYVSKIQTFKYGNKEFVYDLVRSGILPQIGSPPFIAGWSIVQVIATTDNGDGTGSSGDTRFFAVHSNKIDFVDITEVLGAGGSNAFALNATFKVMTRFTYATEIESSTITDIFNWKAPVGLMISFTGGVDAFAILQGMLTASGKLTSIATGKDEDGKVVKAPVRVMGAQKVASITGEGPLFETTDAPSAVEGTITIAAGKADADLSEYGE